jgi:hypothetical protein
MLWAYSDSGFVDTRVRVKQGRTEHQVTPRGGRDAPRYEIITPAATSAVRGTNYRMGATDGGQRSATEVLDGTVDVAARGARRVIPKGFGVVTRKGAPPDPPSRLLDAPALEGLPTRLDRIPLQISLPPIPGAVAYRVQIADTELFRTLRYDALLETPRIKAVDLPDGTYVMRVRGVDGAGLEGLDGYHELTVDARPEPPVLLAPPEAALLGSDSLELQWAEPEGAAAYVLQVATTPDFTSLLIAVADLSENRYGLDLALDPGSYYWRVATRDRFGEQGPFGDPQSFKRLAKAPDIDPPAVDEEQIVFRWSAGRPGDRHEFQLARDKGFQEVLIADTVSQPTYQVSRPESGIYYLRVRTIDADGDAGPYGTPQRIVIPTESYWPLVLMGLAVLLAL